ncbi:3-carboxy-cis,cis-mucoante lactonizing enzyme [Tilletiaria anomala UBC 951]|uniref:3-carboxy-cis,cis-mucoante lactonizing enzyme n=1 Tax=Tilletiaria anomala (strain ATCC 24038 / CBS 436.72 / UBC 951) TaxID=1037660 RepID=A0A066WN60_TILAU|nr:3-carboxy-cis,cis-mucoante lactonizing enzyme [Tilletiaria anomala UBC 951]KDN52414.1 3-carboxy-cis,cis-mucoante lactonizing enzyme [Tilletiaria anomala UBC 951]
MLAVTRASSVCPRFRHLITGTFNTSFLHLLAYDTLNKALFVSRSIEAQGPHQFLAVGRTAQSDDRPDLLYATTWASPPSLSAWRVTGLDDQAGSVTSPSYNVPPGPSRFLYSAGGPTGEVHSLDPSSGALLSKEQELNFLPDPSPFALAQADKTRRALRYGAHNLDVARNGVAYVADLGRNAILAYKVDKKDGTLQLLSETRSPRQGDGPRHVVPSPDGKLIFSVTEHTSYVDVFRVPSSSQAVAQNMGKLEYLQSLDLLPDRVQRADYRGDTVRLSPDGHSVIASTRGKTRATKGIIRAWRLSQSGQSDQPVVSEPLCTYETPTSGGKANAVEFAMRYESGFAASSDAERESSSSRVKDLAVLTDDEQGWLWILEWNGQDLKEVAKTKLPGKGKNDAGDDADEGASHAVWLS